MEIRHFRLHAKVLNLGDVVSTRGRKKLDAVEQLGISKMWKLNCKVLIYLKL